METLNMKRTCWRPRTEFDCSINIGSGRIPKPLVVHGLKDHSSRYSSLGEQLASHGYAVYALKDKTLKLFEGHYHDLFHDLENSDVANDLL